MGSWFYAYMMLAPDENLRSAEALAKLNVEGLTLDDTAFEVLPDEEGHCEPQGRELALGREPQKEAVRLLATGRDLLITFRNSDLYFAVTFARKGKSPCIIVGWSCRLFEALSANCQERYLQLLADFGNAARARAIILMPEPAGYVEDHIAFVDGVLLVDAKLPNGRLIDVQEVWVEDGNVVLENVRLRERKKLGAYRRFA